MNTSVNTTEDYIARFPKEVQPLLQKIRAIIKKAAPKATETISYGIPAFVQGKQLVYFGGFKNHISFFPTSSGIAAFAKELAPYKVSKGTVQFPLDKPLPAALITQIVKYRIKEVEEAAAAKKTTRPVATNKSSTSKGLKK